MRKQPSTKAVLGQFHLLSVSNLKYRTHEHLDLLHLLETSPHSQERLHRRSPAQRVLGVTHFEHWNQVILRCVEASTFGRDAFGFAGLLSLIFVADTCTYFCVPVCGMISRPSVVVVVTVGSSPRHLIPLRVQPLFAAAKYKS